MPGDHREPQQKQPTFSFFLVFFLLLQGRSSDDDGNDDSNNPNLQSLSFKSSSTACRASIRSRIWRNGDAGLPPLVAASQSPASPCHALLEGAAKWASDVPLEERALWVAQAKWWRWWWWLPQPPQSIKCVTPFFYFLTNFLAFQPKGASCSFSPWSRLTPSAPPSLEAALDSTGNWPSRAWRHQPHWKVPVPPTPDLDPLFDCTLT